MMKIIGIAGISVLTYTVVKKYSSEHAFLVELAACALIFFSVFPILCDAIDFFYETTVQAGIGSDYIKILIKTMGLGILTAFTSDVCRDSGQSALASKVEFAGKALIIAVSLPIAEKLLEIAYGVLQ